MNSSRKRSILRQHGGHISEVRRIGPETPPAREEEEEAEAADEVPQGERERQRASRGGRGGRRREVLSKVRCAAACRLAGAG